MNEERHASDYKVEDFLEGINRLDAQVTLMQAVLFALSRNASPGSAAMAIKCLEGAAQRYRPIAPLNAAFNSKMAATVHELLEGYRDLLMEVPGVQAALSELVDEESRKPRAQLRVVKADDGGAL